MELVVARDKVFCPALEKDINVKNICQNGCPLYKGVSRSLPQVDFLQCGYAKGFHKIFRAERFITCPLSGKVSKLHCLKACDYCIGGFYNTECFEETYIVCNTTVDYKLVEDIKIKKEQSGEEEMVMTLSIADKNKLDEVRYVTVTVQNKKVQSNKTTGLFVSIGPLIKINTSTRLLSPNDNFVWLFRGNCAYMFSMDYYNITNIGIGYGDNCKNTISVPYNEAQQEQAIKELTSILAIMEENGKTSSQKLIEITSVYRQIPDEIASKLDLTSKTKTDDVKTTTAKEPTVTKTVGANTTSNTVVNNNVRSGAVNYSSTKSAGYTANNSTYVTETSVIKRTTSYDRSKAMASIRTKLRSIKKGTYKAPKLKVLKVETEEDSTSGSKITTHAKEAGAGANVAHDKWDEEWAGMYGYYGG